MTAGKGARSRPHPADQASPGQPAEPTLTYCASWDRPAALARAARCAEDDCVIGGALVGVGRGLIACLIASHNVCSCVQQAGVLACTGVICSL